MKKSFLAFLILVAFVTLAGFGLLMPTMGHAGHDVGCPFAPAGTALCAAPLAHIKHWQDSFTTILVQVLFFVGVALLFIKTRGLSPSLDPQYVRYRLRAHIPARPPLFQELYSQGILNRKAP